MIAYDTISWNMLGFIPLLLFLLYAAYSDIKGRKIYNSTCILLLISFAIPSIVYQFPISKILYHFAAGIFTLIIFFPLFWARLMGGGDIKLIATTAVWYGFEGLGPLLLFITGSGSILALFVIIYTIIKKRNEAESRSWRERYLRVEFPYGLAILTGALLAFPMGWWFDNY